MYEYEVDDANDVPNIVTGWLGAGRMNHGDFKWTIFKSLDTDYNVDNALKSALSSYKNTELIGIMGDENASSGESGSGETGGGEGGETGGNITFYDKNTATLSLGMTGRWPSDITYTYAGDGSRDISDQPGGVSSLEISGFTLRLQRASADLEIESVSVQYKVYEEGSDGQWNGMEFTMQEDEGGDILAKKYVGTRATSDLAYGLKQGTTYVLEVKYQIIDKNGNYYFFTPSGGNDLYKFSVNNSGGGGGGEGVRGDLNGDGEVSMPDVMFLIQRILNGKFPDE